MLVLIVCGDRVCPDDEVDDDDAEEQIFGDVVNLNLFHDSEEESSAEGWHQQNEQTTAGENCPQVRVKHSVDESHFDNNNDGTGKSGV